MSNQESRSAGGEKVFPTRAGATIPARAARRFGARFGVLAALAATIACTGQIDGGNGAAGGSGGVIGRGGDGVDTDGDGKADGIDVDGDGKIDGVDTDGDGKIDQVPPGGTGGAPGTTPDQVAADCAKQNGMLNVGLTHVRRLTRDQFNNTVRDLVGATGQPADALAPDERVGPFHSNAIAPITELLVEQHHEVAAALATDARSRMNQIAPCDLAADTGTTCATRFVTEFGLRAFRRPLTEQEVQAYVGLYTFGRQGDGAANGFRLVVEALLQSPFFLYHHDVGSTGAPQPGPVAVTSYELASRLSYFLWNSMPDAQLFTLAGDGSLLNDAVIDAQVERMLDDPRAAGTIGLFHRQWLALDDLAGREKDTAVFPGFNAALADAMLRETELFSDHVIRGGDGSLRTLLTSNLAFPQGGLFGLYGVTQPAGYMAGTPVPLDASRRAGILTQAAFLTRHAHRDQTSPVHRGLTVRENLMCQTIPPPPPDVNTTPPPASAATSTRQRFAQHVADPACGGCHSMMDPIGLGFEHYDAIGAFRSMDGAGPVDATGQINAASSSLNGAFNGAIELANKLANAQQVSDCVANQWFRFSLGRMESSNDACSIQAIRQGFTASGTNIRALLAQIAKSPAFRNVRASGG